MISNSHYLRYDNLLPEVDVKQTSSYPRHLLFQLLRKRIKNS
jgi:hypothetical protein